jgi:hypothetical protein
MPSGDPRPTRRPLFALASAALLVLGGLMLAVGASGGPPHSNKADGYGGPVAPKPTNPKSVAECAKYYGSSNPTPDARDCRAKAKRNAGNRKCAKKKGAAKAKCKKAVKKAYAKEEAAIARQRKAQQACTDKYNADIQALDPEAEDYDAKLTAAGEAYNSCLQAAQKA